MAVTYYSLELSASLSSLSLLVATTMYQGHHFSPFLSPLAPFLAPLAVALSGATLLLLSAAFALPRMKAAPTTFLPEAFLVAMSSSSLVVLG
jgi:hypothetical protein